MRNKDWLTAEEARSRLSYDRTGDLIAQIACKPDAAQ